MTLSKIIKQGRTSLICLTGGGEIEYNLKDIKEKTDVANDVVIFIDAIKDYLVQTVLKQDLNDLSECVYHWPLNDEGEDLSATIS